MGAVERAQQDFDNGQYWLARNRLKSYLVSHGYDPNVLAQIGRISYAMHDQFDAGRRWLLSGAVGEEVEAAIETFVAHAGKHSNQIASLLPRSIRLDAVERYPELVRERIERFGLRDSIIRKASEESERGRVPWYITALLLVLVLFSVVIFCLGLHTLHGWLFG